MFSRKTKPRKRRVIAYMGGNVSLTKTIYGSKIFVDTRDTSLAPSLLLDGNWEPRISDAFAALVKPGMTVIDVGANFGWYTLLAARLTGRRGRVICVEANPSITKLLTRTMAANGYTDFVTVENIAVSDIEGDLTLSVDPEYLGGGSLLAAYSEEALRSGAAKQYTVTAKPLDALVPPGGRVDVIKIDAEGAEPAILRGAARIIRENAGLHVLLEFGTLMLAASPGGAVGFYRDIVSYGLKPYRIAKGGFMQGKHRLVPFTEAEAAVEGFHNLVLKKS